jgi:hypothetical protein
LPIIQVSNPEKGRTRIPRGSALTARPTSLVATSGMIAGKRPFLRYHFGKELSDRKTEKSIPEQQNQQIRTGQRKGEKERKRQNSFASSAFSPALRQIESGQCKNDKKNRCKRAQV